MKKLLAFILGALSLHNVSGQSIDIYYPLGDLDPTEVDEYGGAYTRDIVTIYGVVSEDSQGAFHGHEKYRTHSFTLRGWRQEGQIEDQKLLVFRPIAYKTDFFGDIPMYSIVKLELYLNEARNRAVLLSGEILSNPEDDLLKIREELQRPVFLETEEFGTFKLNKSINWFEGSVVWNQGSVKLIIDVETATEITDEFNTLRELIANQKVWKKIIDNYAVKELLPLKNDAWLGEGEQLWEKDKFIRTYKLQSISISEGGAFQFWHDDGDLFWGHAILIEGTVKAGPINADIPG